jgi:hypothetical protein
MKTPGLGTKSNYESGLNTSGEFVNPSERRVCIIYFFGRKTENRPGSHVRHFEPCFLPILDGFEIEKIDVVRIGTIVSHIESCSLPTVDIVVQVQLKLRRDTVLSQVPSTFLLPFLLCINIFFDERLPRLASFQWDFKPTSVEVGMSGHGPSPFFIERLP